VLRAVLHTVAATMADATEADPRCPGGHRYLIGGRWWRVALCWAGPGHLARAALEADPDPKETTP
jgi:hypothetical protein